MHFRLSKSPSDVDIGFGFQVALGGNVDLQVDLALVNLEDFCGVVNRFMT